MRVAIVGFVRQLSHWGWPPCRSGAEILALVVLSSLTLAISPSSAQPAPEAAAENLHEHGPGQEMLNEPDTVIPPGQENLIAELVGCGETLPGDCKLTAGQVERISVRATYACSSGEVVYDLRHPSAAPANSTATSRFAVVLVSGTPPPGFADALVARIRAREATFQWRVLPRDAQGSSAGLHSRFFVAAAVIVALLLLAWALWARASARQRGSR